MSKVNLRDKFARIAETWSPKIIAELNGQQVKLAKLEGEFVWHRHDNEDELFLVWRGRLLIKLRDRDIWLEEGELFVVPRGVEHKPVTEGRVEVLLLEPKGTLNTGNVHDERTVSDPDRI